jgi:FtsH-binding integral membrane protein
MNVIGYILFGVGFLAVLLGEILFLTVAYKRSFLWFFGCLFVPIVCWIFFFFNMKATIRPLALQISGLILAAVGGHLIWPGSGISKITP